MTFSQDLRFAFRMLGKNPGTSAVIILTLAVGIGINTTVFTLANAVLFRGLPFEDSARIMHVSAQNRERGDRRAQLSYPDYVDYKATSKALQDLAAFQLSTANVSDGSSTPERYSGARMTSNSFAIIGQKPVIGRDFLPEDAKPGAPSVAIIGHGMWKNRYGGAGDVLGKTIRINEVQTTIIGVMPEDFRFPLRNDLWVPLVPKADLEKRDNRSLNAYGKLAVGATLVEATTELQTVNERLMKEYPKTNKSFGVRVEPYNDVFNGGEIRILFLAMLGAVGFVLLIACANVANLLLSRSIARGREMSIRAALGASRWRIIRQLLTEALILGFAGGGLGLLIATQGVRLFDMAVADVAKPYWIRFTFDLSVFAYLAAVCLLTAILFGLLPALQAAKTDVNSTLKEGGRGATGRSRGWLSGSLVVVELALSVVLLAGAGLMIRSFFHFYGMHEGLDTERIMTMRFNLPEAKYPKQDVRARFVEAVDQRVKTIPGVVAAALVSHPPGNGYFGWQFQIEGQPSAERERRPIISGIVITPAYFDALGVPLLRGRAFTATDGEPGKEAVIVNQRFAARHWPNQDPIGKRLRLIRDDKEQPWMTVWGVSRDIRQNSPQQTDIEPLIYVPHRQDPSGFMAIFARTAVDPTSVTSALRQQVAAVDADLPLFEPRTLSDNIRQQRWFYTVFSTVFVVFATIALLLSAIGIYGVIAYSVSQRTQEIGVRVALGAGTRDIVRLVMSRGVIQLGIGVTIGLAGAFAITRVISTLLVQVSATDPVTFAAVTGILVGVGVLACLLPARKALRVDPTTALRYE